MAQKETTETTLNRGRVAASAWLRYLKAACQDEWAQKSELEALYRLLPPQTDAQPLHDD